MNIKRMQDVLNSIDETSNPELKTKIIIDGDTVQLINGNNKIEVSNLEEALNVLEWKNASDRQEA